MAKRIAVPSKDLQLRVIGPLESFKASRVQKANFGVTIPSTTVDELGNSLHVGESSDMPNVTVGFTAFDVGIKIFSVLTGTDYTAYPADGVDISKLGEIDAALYIKGDSTNDYVKCIHARRLQIQNFSFAFSVAGEATEDYNAIGSERRYLKYDVVTQKFTTGTTSFVITETPKLLSNGKYFMSVILDGNYLDEVTGTPATGEYKYTPGTKTITTYDTRSNQLIAVFHADPAGSNWADVSDPLMPPAIKGKDNKVVISANDIPRVQNITINGNMNTQAVKEMGNRETPGYQRQVPTVDGTITVLDTDTDLISLLTTGVLGSGEEWQPGESDPAVPISLAVKLLDPSDSTSPYTVLKEIYIPEITIVGDSYTSNVNNNAQQTFNWKSTNAECVVYSGEKPA